MTVELFLTDAYTRSFESRILRLDGREMILAETAFYPGGGGQPADKGRLKVGPVAAAVIDVRRKGDSIVHVLDRRIPDTIEHIGGELDWERRYTHMRYRTALHVLSGFIQKDFGAEVTGGRLRTGRAWLDFLSPGEWPAEATGSIECLVNEALSGGRPVRVYGADLQETLAGGRPDVSRVRAGLVPENAGKGRVVEIEGLGVRVDGGMHVANTREVGEIEITGHKSKDGQEKRLEFVLR